PDGPRYGHRARSRRHPMPIGHVAAGLSRCALLSHNRRRPDPPSTARTSLGYSRVLAGRGESGRKRAAVRQGKTRYLAVPTIPALFASYSPPTVRAAKARGFLDPTAYSPALARRLRRGVGSPVPRT